MNDPASAPARALVTGAGGFVGKHLLAHLSTGTDWQLYGNVQHDKQDRPAQPRPVSWITGDLTDRDSATRVIEQVRPDYVFHLAAQSNVQLAFEDPQSTLTNNIVSQLNLLNALREYASGATTIVVGSGEQYGLVRPEEIPITEDTPFRPNNPYAVSKIAQDTLALQHFLSWGQKTIRVRPFNHIGPGQTEHFVTSAFARQIARIEAGLQEPAIYVGNLEAVRDFTDVRDMVSAYLLVALRGEPGEVYNIGSGQGHTIQWVLDQLIGLSHIKVEIKQDPLRMRPSDIPSNVCDPSRFRACTGWQPKIPLEQTLSDILHYWREVVRRDA